MLTGLLAGMLDAFLLTYVFWDESCSMLCLMIAHRHAISAFPANDQPLQKGRPFSCWAMFSVATKDLTVLLQLLTIRFKLLPSDVAHMDVLEENGHASCGTVSTWREPSSPLLVWVRP